LISKEKKEKQPTGENRNDRRIGNKGNSVERKRN
jgi:hypothetical protein